MTSTKTVASDGDPAAAGSLSDRPGWNVKTELVSFSFHFSLFLLTAQGPSAGPGSQNAGPSDNRPRKDFGCGLLSSHCAVNGLLKPEEGLILLAEARIDSPPTRSDYFLGPPAPY